MDLRHAASVLWPRRLTLLTVALLGGLGGFIVSVLMPPTFESEATLLVADASGRPPSAYEDLLATEILARTYAELGHTTPILVAALDRAGVTLEPAELAEVIVVEPIRNSALIRVVARASSSRDAQRLTSAVASGVAELATGNEEGMQLVVVDPAEEPEEPVSPRVAVNVVVGTAAAILGAAAILLLVTRRSQQPAPQFTTFEEQARRRRSVGTDRFGS